MSDKQNYNLEQIITDAGADAQSRGDSYVRTEHLLLVALKDGCVATPLKESGFKLNHVIDSINQFLDNKTHSVNNIANGTYNETAIRSTQQVAGLIQTAKTVEQFYKMKTKGMEEMAEEMIGDNKHATNYASWAILQSILKLNKRQSYASTILQKYGLTVDKLKTIFQETHEKNTMKTVISEYCVNLNDLCKEDKIDPIIGRETEILDTIEILSKRKKANVVLVGMPGTGKSALGEGIALMIEKGEIPKAMEGFTVLSVDLAGMVAGAKYRGDFEDRLKKVIKHAEENPKTILFFDEIHQMFGAGANNQSPMDASNILKPALASGRIRVIGTTTYDEYSTHFRKDGAFSRRFVKIDVEQPTPDETRLILDGIIDYYADFHNVEYHNECINMAVDLAERYMRNKYFPDKAIDLIDAAGARAKLREADEVVGDDIVAQVSKMAHIPENMISVKETDIISTLEDRMNDVVFGQEEAIEKITESIFIAKSGLREVNKPIANFMFLGSTGTGKTYACKQLAEIMNSTLVRFDMSEYQERHTVSKLIGSPPGYVGYGEGQAGEGLLISKIDENPSCVLLLDEIEKAHKDVYKLLLQVMDDGTLTSSTGKKVDFSNVILIMTSNVGMEEASKNSIGFVSSRKNHAIIDAMKKFFAPEFLNRIDSTVVFNRLDMNHIKMIVDAEITKTNDMLMKNHIQVSLNTSAKEKIAELGYDEDYGARPLTRAVADNIKLPLSKKIIKESLSHCQVRVGYNKKDGFTMTVTEYDGTTDLKELVENVEA